MKLITTIMRDKVNQEPKNEYGDPHGQWICYNSDGTLWFMDHNINGVECGYGIYQERYEDGELIYVKEYYAR
jgi:hypothetical protein